MRLHSGLSPLDPSVVAFKAGRLLLSELRELMNRHETFALESTLSGRTYVNVFERAKQNGYKIELQFVWIPMCAKRSAACASESSKVATMFRSTTSGDASPEAFNTCSMITRR